MDAASELSSSKGTEMAPGKCPFSHSAELRTSMSWMRSGLLADCGIHLHTKVWADWQARFRGVATASRLRV